MEMIIKTIRITEEQVLFLLSTFKNINQGVRYCIDRAMKRDSVPVEIRYSSREELRGRFTKKEWIYFFDALNGTTIIGRLRCSAQNLVINCEEADKREGIADKWEIELPVLLEKIRGLTGAQVEALYTFVEEFWNDPKRDLHKASEILL